MYVLDLVYIGRTILAVRFDLLNGLFKAKKGDLKQVVKLRSLCRVIKNFCLGTCRTTIH